MSQALYRRYRPETFAEVIGQEHVTGPLTAALGRDRINHAYLFSGPRGCGKTTSARILARCLNCAEGPTADPCGVCESCRDLARGGPGSLDVVEIDAASHGGVDDARSLRERAAFAPARDRYKVFVIDEAHMVSTQGFNALLKIVEEPPPHVRFVFATTEPDKVIGTIRSRTHHYPFRLVPPERLQGYLAELCEQEGVPVGQGVLPLVVRAGAGSVRDSLSVLDQLIAGAGQGGLTYPSAVALLGYTDGALLDDVVDALAAGDGGTVFSVVDRVIETGIDPRRFVEDLLERLRDLVVVAAVPDGAGNVLRAVSGDQLDRMAGQASRFGRAELSRAADVVNAALTDMTGATSPRLQLELLCARLLLPGADEGERGLRARMDRLEKRVGMAGTGLVAPGAAPAPAGSPAGSDTAPGGGPRGSGASSPDRDPAQPPGGAARPAERSGLAGRPAPDRASGGAAARPSPGPGASGSASAPVGPGTEPGAGPAPGPGAPAASVADTSATAATGTGPDGTGSGPGSGGAGQAPGRPDTATVRRMWPEVLAKLSGLRRTTWSLVSPHAQVLDYDGERLLLGFATSGLAGSFTRGPHQEYLRQALIDALGLDCRIETATGDRPPPSRQGPGGPGAPGGQAGSGGPGGSGAPQRSAGPPAGTGWDAPSRGGPPAPGRGAGSPGSGGRPSPDGPPSRPDTAPGRPEAPAGPPGPSGSRAPGPPGGASPDGPGRSGPTARPVTRTAPARRPGGPRASAADYDDIPPPDEPLPEDGPPEDAPPDTSATAARSRPAPPARPASPSRPEDDEPSADDLDMEGSGLVGAPVIEKLLGGRVIEERQE